MPSASAPPVAMAPAPVVAQPVGVVAASAPPAAMMTSSVKPPAPGAAVQLPGLSKEPTSVTCPNCGHQGTTTTQYAIDACTIISVILLILLFWPLFWIPFVGTCCKSANHFCRNCHTKLGTVGNCGN